MAQINKFDGGIVTGYNDMYIGQETAVALVDVDIARKALVSAASSVRLQNNVKAHFYEYPVSEEIVRYEDTEDEEIALQFVEPYTTLVTSSATHRAYTEFQGRLAYSDGGPLCKITDGTLNSAGDDFNWVDIGTEAPTGSILSRVITVVEDIPTAEVTLVGNSSGFIDISLIRYRVVDADDTVYVHEISDNPGNATVTWVLPIGFKVYRELVDNYGDHTDVFAFVGSGTFTDGATLLEEGYEFVNTIATEDRSSYRVSLVDGEIYSIPYSIIRTSTDISISISYIYSLEDDDSWSSTPIQLSISDTNQSLGAIASSFSYNDILYIMLRCGNVTNIYNSTGLVYSGTAIDDEYFKGSTVEHIASPGGERTLYIFNPRDGKVLLFDGTSIEIKDTEVFPYATAQNSVYTINGDTVYALINDSTEANVRSIHLPDLYMGYTGYERIKLDKIKGLGGTSGCDMTIGDFQIFPVMKGVISFSRLSNQVAKQDNEAATTANDVRGYIFESGLTHLISGAKIISWKYIGSSFDFDILDTPTLTGTYLYNVCQLTGTGLDGPIMLSETNPVSVYKGHIIVDTTGITHTTDLRLYRTGGYLTIFKMVLDDIPLPADAYIDKIDDVSLGIAREGSYSQVYAPPTGLKWLTSHNGLLFGAVDNKLYWSEAGIADYWDPSVNLLLLDTPIYGLVSGSNGLIIFMEKSVSLLIGYSPDDFELRTVIKDRGANGSYGIQPARGGALFFTRDGLAHTDGMSITDISYELLGPNNFQVISSCITDRTYFALIDNFTDSAYGKIVLTYNMDKTIAFSSLNGDKVTSLGLYNGRVAHTYNETLFNTLGGSNTRLFYYKSGNITMELPTYIKEWDRVRVTGEYIGMFKVYIDDILVLSELINTVERVNFHLPKHDNKGKAIRFEAEGIGTIISIEYSVTERDSTK